MTRNEISVKMRFQHILDSCSVFFCPFNIGGNFAQRIDDGSLAFAFNIVGSLSQATSIDLFYFHWLVYLYG